MDTVIRVISGLLTGVCIVIVFVAALAWITDELDKPNGWVKKTINLVLGGLIKLVLLPWFLIFVVMRNLPRFLSSVIKTRTPQSDIVTSTMQGIDLLVDEMMMTMTRVHKSQGYSGPTKPGLDLNLSGLDLDFGEVAEDPEPPTTVTGTVVPVKQVITDEDLDRLLDSSDYWSSE